MINVVGVGVLCPVGIRGRNGCHDVVNVCFCLRVSDYEFKLARRLSTDLDQLQPRLSGPRTVDQMMTSV